MEKEPFLLDVPSREQSRDKRVGREISFGIQQTLACWATDFIDPAVGQWYQNKYGHHDHKVTAGHTWGGEIAGDSAAFFIYMAAKRLLTSPIDALIVGTKKTFDPIYTKLGRKAIKNWAQSNHIEKDDPRYARKLEMYKEFQAENLVDTGIIALSSVAVNVGAQRKLGNKQAISTIFKSKILGSAATVAVMLGLRTAVPTAMKTLDDELSDRYFSKVARGVGRAFGVKASHIRPVVPAAFEADPEAMVSLADAPISPRALSNEKRAGFLARLHRTYADQGRDPNNVQDFSDFIDEQRQMCDAFIHALHPRGDFARELSGSYYDVLRSLQAVDTPEGMTGKLLKKSARVGIQSIVVNRRDDQTGFKKLLADEEFLGELKALVTSPAKPKPLALSREKQEDLIESLVQTKGPLGREPAVHIFGHAKGQIIEHQALAEAYNPDGPTTQLLTGELKKHLPDLAMEQVARMAKDYMQDRQIAAQLVVQDLRLDGYIVNEAIRRSEAVRLAGQTPVTHVEKNAERTSDNFAAQRGA